MTTSVIPFDYKNNAMRVVEIDNEPWFIAADIAAILEYGSAKDFVRGIDNEDKGRHIVPTPGGPQEMTIISEAGLFEIKQSTSQQPDGTVRITKTPKITGKGQQFSIDLFLGSEAVAA